MQAVNSLVYLVFSYFILSGLSHGAEKFRVVDADTNKGIRAYIDKVDISQNKKRVSITDEDGYIRKEFTCELLEKLIITPVSHRSYYLDSFDCPISKELVSLKSNKRQKNLVSNADWSIENGDFGTAALAYSEAAYRLSSMNQNRLEYVELEVKAYNAAASYLAIVDSTVFDINQNKPVMSPQLKEALVNLQNEKGLKVTGELDFQTLSIISNKTLSEVLFMPPVQN